MDDKSRKFRMHRVKFQADAGDYFRHVPESGFWVHDNGLSLEGPENYPLYTDISGMDTFVVKVGTSVITHDDDRRMHYTMRCLAEELKWLRSTGNKVILVTSGAIGLGKKLRSRYGERLTEDGWNSPGQRQKSAELGQPVLYKLWEAALYPQRTAESLVVNDDMASNRKRSAVLSKYSKWLSDGVIPVVNEDDKRTLAEIEIVLDGERVFRDNDGLQCLVSCGLLEYGFKPVSVKLTNTDGIYTSESCRTGQFETIRVVKSFDGLEEMALPEKSGEGRGGMLSAIHAARDATKKGVYEVIANGLYCNHDSTFQRGGAETRKFYPLRAIAEGKVIGTRCLPVGYGH